MLVLHAAFYQDCLHLWGETAPPETAARSRIVAGTYRYRATAPVLLEALTLAGLTPAGGKPVAGERIV
ncbi:MAG: hypothetical protein WBQ37_16400, partial [Candidatus Competibacter sp.]